MIYVYAIQSIKDGRIYVGMTADIAKRIQQHNNGLTFSTRLFAPWKLIHSESFPDRITARKREKYLKSGVGKEFLKSIVIVNNTNS
jgi:putative endonuclease